MYIKEKINCAVFYSIFVCPLIDIDNKCYLELVFGCLHKKSRWFCSNRLNHKKAFSLLIGNVEQQQNLACVYLVARLLTSKDCTVKFFAGLNFLVLVRVFGKMYECNFKNRVPKL
ncbi:CLUMA_CG013332, isoform A [Clunio marinus]|uniref:CLUMA_CG013332, isoform A n=1 Tax=Clunio marinus TaxID=568069 RepID=A0A1J1IKI6_9DIPT|nr:CLUMA_CG013332, isoform A [Clunio marinus]